MEEVSGHLPKSIVHRCIVRIVCSFRPFCFPSLSLFFLFLLYVFLCCPCFFPNLSTVLFFFTERLFTALGFSSFFLWVTCVLSWPTPVVFLYFSCHLWVRTLQHMNHWLCYFHVKSCLWLAHRPHRKKLQEHEKKKTRASRQKTGHG